MPTSADRPAYRERLHVPVAWWLLGAVLVVAVWWAFYVAVPAPVPWIALAVAVVVIATALRAYGRLCVWTDSTGLHAGSAWLDWDHLGPVEALDPAGRRALMGVDADVRAHLVTRPYCHRAVKVGVADMADPTPYWVISTRHPDALADHLNNRVVQD